MKTADFLGTQPFLNHLQRRRTPRRLLMLCLFSALCLGGSVAFEVSVHVEEKRAEAGQRPMPEAAQAQVELGEIYGEMNTFSQALDPLAEHLARPTAAGMLAGLDQALGPEVEVERVAWSRKVKADKKGKTKANGPEILVLEVEVIATNEETATSLDAVLAAYTGMKAQIQGHKPVKDRWPAVRMTVRLESEVGALLKTESKS
jgi:hypothetical protein